MFDKFDEYMQYLLPSAFKRQKKQNQLLVYCRVIGRLYDSLLQSILRLREETIIATCSPEILEVFGSDYDMPRMQGETSDMYRRRLQMKALVAEAAGTQKGILYALASVGYDNCTITPLYLTNPDRWAEIRINIFTPDIDVDNPIAFMCVIAEVAKVKKASTLPRWRFSYPVKIWHTDINSIQAAIRNILYIQFWGDCSIYNGQNQYDGKLQYDTRRNYKPDVFLINQMHIHWQETGRVCTNARVQICNHENATAFVRICCDIDFLNYVWQYDMHNAFLINRMHIHWQETGRVCTYAKVQICNHEKAAAFVHNCYSIRFWDYVWWNDKHMVFASKIKLYTAQAIQYKHLALHMRITSKGKATARYISRYQIKSKPKKKTRVRIHMEMTNAKEKIDNIYVETCRNVAFFDGALKYDGTAKYDALYRKEEVE